MCATRRGRAIPLVGILTLASSPGLGLVPAGGVAVRTTPTEEEDSAVNGTLSSKTGALPTLACVTALILGVAIGGAAQTHPVDLHSTTGPTPPPGVAPKIPGTPPPSPRAVIIAGVPAYWWRHGCGPTSVGMVIGYYDVHGYDDLFPGDASTQTAEVDQAIASQRSAVDPGHYEDYSLPLDDEATGVLPDRSEPPGGDEHVSDCLADFMGTSWSVHDMLYGWSMGSRVAPAFESYIGMRNPEYAPLAEQHLGVHMELTWELLTSEIDAGHPMVFLVDTVGDGFSDHFVTVVGYSSDPFQHYGCLDTWDPVDEIRWCEFAPYDVGQPWGVYRGYTFRPSLTLIVDAAGGGDYTTIGDAIAAAPERAWIRVESGTYTGPENRDLDPVGKELWIFSAAGPESTIIDCEGSGRGFYFHTQEDSLCVVEGFTIRNGTADRGGGVRCFFNSSPTLRDLVIEGCEASVGGGGLHCGAAASPVIEGVTFTGNTSSGNGGAVCLNAASPRMSQVTICGNSADGQTSGIHAAGASAPAVTNAIIAYGGSGGAVFCDASSDLSITHSCVWANSGGDSLCGAYSDNLFANPLFCGADEGDLELRDDSQCLPGNNAWGELIGAHGQGECATGVDGVTASEVVLHPAAPNPFYPSTAIAFELPGRSTVDLRIYDVRGRLVRTLLEADVIDAGRHTTTWDGRDRAGERVASGVYFYRIEVDGAVATQRMVLLR